MLEIHEIPAEIHVLQFHRAVCASVSDSRICGEIGFTRSTVVTAHKGKK